MAVGFIVLSGASRILGDHAEKVKEEEDYNNKNRAGDKWRGYRLLKRTKHCCERSVRPPE